MPAGIFVSVSVLWRLLWWNIFLVEFLRAPRISSPPPTSPISSLVKVRNIYISPQYLRWKTWQACLVLLIAHPSVCFSSLLLKPEIIHPHYDSVCLCRMTWLLFTTHLRWEKEERAAIWQKLWWIYCWKAKWGLQQKTLVLLAKAVWSRSWWNQVAAYGFLRLGIWFLLISRHSLETVKHNHCEELHCLEQQSVQSVSCNEKKKHI